jgi:[citrate (pro-3S)-lyase] ligase
VVSFLARHGLDYEDDIEYSIGLFSGEAMVATGSLSGKVVKGVVVDASHRGEDLTARVLTYLKIRAHNQNIDSLFIYTLPENRERFIPLGYTEIASTEEVLLLEDTSRNFSAFLSRLSGFNPEGLPAAALVMNCNPFTLGHRYLVERTASENPLVLLFVVQEDRSVFPFSVRMKLIEEGTRDLENVRVIPGGDYIISNATFPSYFLKDKGKIFDTHTRLDLTIFGEHIAPAAGIRRRYVGQEPFCPVTRRYNQSMHEILPDYGLEVVEIERREFDNKAISASEVRRLIAAGKIEEAAKIVPPSTYKYLTSAEAENIRRKLQGGSA